jgi:hypothetical protein
MKNRSTVFMVGAGHSGSTLLGLMLGAHPAVFYAGEAKKSAFLGDERKPLKKRVCKLCGPSCQIWGDLTPSDFAASDLYEVLSERTARPVVVDSTKATDWIGHGVAAVRARGGDVRLIFLQRDGRAVVSSRLRKYPETSAAEHARDWRTQMEASRAFADAFAGSVIEVRYEALATEPERELRRVASFLDLEFDTAMLTPWTTEQHPLGGNSGTQWLMARAQQSDGSVLTLGDKTRDYYETHPPAIVFDERWRRELSAEGLAAFEAEAGETNVPYAWDAGAKT